MRDALRPAFLLAALAGTTLVVEGFARAEWHDPIAGATEILPADFEQGEAMLTVHAVPHHDGGSTEGDGLPNHWTLPLVDRRLDTGTRFAPLSASLLETINRVEPIYDPTLLDGPNVIVSLHVSAGTAETRDVFGDHWRIASADPNVDADARPLATAWTAGSAPRPCGTYRVRRRHEWREPALSATTAADCRAILARQARGFSDTSPLKIAAAAPPIPVFAAPDPGSRMSSLDFWASQRARIAGIHAHLHRKWLGARPVLRSALNNPP